MGNTCSTLGEKWCGGDEFETSNGPERMAPVQAGPNQSQRLSDSISVNTYGNSDRTS